MESIERFGPVSRDDAKAQLQFLAADRAKSGARAAAPWWLIVLHGASVAAFALSFGLGEYQTAGFALSTLAFIGLGMIRPWVTRNHAEPWSHSRRAVLPGVLQMVAAILVIAAGVIAWDGFGIEWALWPTAILAGAVTVLFGLRMERALARDVTEGG
jgi:hypothetical protein